MVQQPPPFWSPLRYGTGRRPSVMGVGLELVFGFLMLLGGVVLWGLDPVCIAAGLPLLVIGALVGLWGFRSLWALGDRREAWTAAALSAYAIPPVVMACIAVFGWRVAIDLLWLALAVGVPSLVLVAGTGREVGRRATFALFFGPVLLISALTLAVLDPEGFGETGAMPVLTVSVGAGWGFTGFVTARKREGGRDPLSVVAAGGSAGLAIAAAAGGMDLAAAGDLTLTATLAVVLWVGTAAYVTVVSLLPSLRRLRPGARASYAVLAVSGAAALITAAAIFLADGMHVVGSVEAIMGLAMVVMTAPEMRGIGPSAAALSVLGALLGVSSVLAVSVAL